MGDLTREVDIELERASGTRNKGFQGPMETSRLNVRDTRARCHLTQPAESAASASGRTCRRSHRKGTLHARLRPSHDRREG